MPYVVYVGDDGTPDFKVTDEAKRKETLRLRQCAICGQRLGETMAFIGGPLCEKNRLFSDGPMHSECARYSAAVCPYLALGRARETDPKDGQMIMPMVKGGRPPRMAIFYSRGYSIVSVGSVTYIKSHPFTSVDWSVIPECPHECES